jgi:hypothetical protein
MRRAGLLVLLLAGCRLGGGPTIGFRGGQVTGGWQMNMAVADIGGGDNFGLGGELGQSWRNGRAWTFGALTLDGFEVGSSHSPNGFDVNVDRFDGLGGEAGLVGAEGRYHGFVGGNLFIGSARGNSCDAQYLTSLTFGIRFFGKATELYLAPRLEVYTSPCFD